MKADTVGPWVNIYTDFGRYIEAPCVVLYFVDVEITGHLLYSWLPNFNPI